jgi:hypothetical protein
MVIFNVQNKISSRTKGDEFDIVFLSCKTKFVVKYVSVSTSLL